MDDLLDLSVTLTSPPAGAVPDVVAAITLRCEQLDLAHAGDLLTAPLTTEERRDLRWYLEEYWKWPYEGFAERGRRVEALLPELGERLYRLAFGSAGAMAVVRPWRLQPGVRRQISVASTLPAALSLPWELLHDGAGFLALRTGQPISIVRRLPQRELAARPAPFTPPLRVLVVTARPEGTGWVDQRIIARELLDELEKQIRAGTIALEFLRPPTLPALRRRLADASRPPVHVLHFDGHGAFTGAGRGLLAFENDDGGPDRVAAETLRQVLRDTGVRLAVLTACRSALGAEDDAFSSVAAQLLGGGVDAAAAMSASILVAGAARYTEGFYRALADGTPAPTAQERARQALHDDPRRHLHRRRSEDEAAPVELRDWWLPHFYQQRPLTLRPAAAPAPAGAPAGAPPERLSEGMPDKPRYGFSGRARELHRLERWLGRKRLVVIHGFGGSGKTALAREAADWLTRTGLYAGACFVSFEPGGEAALLLATLGRSLGIDDGAYDPGDVPAALARLERALKERPTLVIADNLESVLPRGEAELEPAARTQLWDVLLELARLGAGVLLTTRDTGFGDGRLAPGPGVAHQPLGGLHPDDAYLLASSLLGALDIPRARAPYPELRDLLAQLGHHPLAIQLVLPALDDHSLATIRADFAALLPAFRDDTQTGRNRSLLASLEYSLRRLTAEQRALLPRLAPFEGGASEDSVLTITGIPAPAWATLRAALEQAALLTAEPVADRPAPFLRFHPALIPWVRGQPGADDPALRERHARRYADLAGLLAVGDAADPWAARALARRELPNLRRAFDLLLERGAPDAAADMADGLARFLSVFGLRRERDRLVRRVAMATPTADRSAPGALSRAEYVRESRLGESELQRGDLPAARARFGALLDRIRASPEGRPLGRGSPEHGQTLLHLARCLYAGAQPRAAEALLREALGLAEQHPDDREYRHLRGMVLGDLTDALIAQGKHLEARTALEQGLRADQQRGDVRGQAVGQAQLGLIALEQREYAEARARYVEARRYFEALGEPASQAAVWHQLGRIAEEQGEAGEAERCYRASLALKEQHGDAAGAAATCNQLAIVAKADGRTDEAESWYRRALAAPDLPAPEEARYRNNLANLLLKRAQRDPALRARLAEARTQAERALELKEALEPSAGIWMTLNVLAGIADLEGRVDAAGEYRRRARESFAAYPGSRDRVDRQHGPLIAAIAAAARGEAPARATAEAALPDLEAKGWRIAAAVRRIWAGERDLDPLVADLDGQDALLVRRVLETIGEGPASRPGSRLPR